MVFGLRNLDRTHIHYFLLCRVLKAPVHERNQANYQQNDTRNFHYRIRSPKA